MVKLFGVSISNDNKRFFIILFHCSSLFDKQVIVRFGKMHIFFHSKTKKSSLGNAPKTANTD